MAEFTYETRRKISEAWVNDVTERGKRLSDLEKEMLPHIYGYSIPPEACSFMRKRLMNGEYSTLSGLYKGEFPDLVKVCVPESSQEEFYFALDEMNHYQMTAG